MTHSHKTYHADYAVVGSGVAGLRAAIELSGAGSVLVLAKSNLNDSATAWAQAGVAVALSDEDQIGLHEQDTINAGDGLCRTEAVGLMVEEGPKYITELMEWGTEFSREGTKAGVHARGGAQPLADLACEWEFDGAGDFAGAAGSGAHYPTFAFARACVHYGFDCGARARCRGSFY